MEMRGALSVILRFEYFQFQEIYLTRPDWNRAPDFYTLTRIGNLFRRVLSWAKIKTTGDPLFQRTKATESIRQSFGESESAEFDIRENEIDGF